MGTGRDTFGVLLEHVGLITSAFPSNKYFWTNKQTHRKILDEGALGTGKLERGVSDGRAGTASLSRSLAA